MTTKTLTLKLATVALALSTYTFNSCKEDEPEYSFDDCISTVKFSEINDGDILQGETTNFSRLLDIKKKYNTKNDIKYGYNVFVGTSKENLKKIDNIYKEYELQPFTMYYLECVPYIINGSDTAYGNKKELKFYSIPELELVLNRDFGDGEIATNINWKLQYFYKNEGENSRNRKYYEYTETPISVSANLITKVDTAYNKGTIEFSVDENTCYIKQGGTREKPDFPAYINKYWKDGKTVMRYESIIYDANVTVGIQIGDTSINVNNSIQTILMDKQQCVCDKDLNVYRIAKIGNKTWTIDNYIGLHEYDNSNLENVSSPFYGENEYLHFYLFGNDLSKSPIIGYHAATNEDWEDLENFYGIVYPSDTLNMDLAKKIAEKDSSLQKYFTKEGAWYELLSSFGWQDDEGNFITREQGAFNAIPIGLYIETHYYIPGIVTYWEERYDIIGVYNMVAYRPYGGGATRIITNNGIAKCKDGDGRYSVRFVKD